jgi:hypothetical protein
MREAANFLAHGMGTLEGENDTVVRLDVAFDNNLLALGHLLDEAGKRGWSGAFINKNCYVEAFDARVRYIIETLEFILTTGPGASSTASYFAYETEKRIWN